MMAGPAGRVPAHRPAFVRPRPALSVSARPKGSHCVRSRAMITWDDRVRLHVMTAWIQASVVDQAVFDV